VSIQHPASYQVIEHDSDGVESEQFVIAERVIVAQTSVQLCVALDVKLM